MSKWYKIAVQRWAQEGEEQEWRHREVVRPTRSLPRSICQECTTQPSWTPQCLRRKDSRIVSKSIQECPTISFRRQSAGLQRNQSAYWGNYDEQRQDIHLQCWIPVSSKVSSRRYWKVYSPCATVVIGEAGRPGCEVCLKDSGMELWGWEGDEFAIIGQ